jgi:DNA-binding CsgD family transcriptional regulator
MDLNRLIGLANFLTLEKNLTAAVQFIALNACLSGHPSRFYLAEIKEDFELKTLASFGYRKDVTTALPVYNLLSNPILNQVLQSGEILIRDRKKTFRDAFTEMLASNDDMPWLSTVFLPLTPNFVATISTQVLVPDEDYYRDHFTMLKSILCLYIHHLHDGAHSEGRERFRSKVIRLGDDLTERQKLILELIKSGMTNVSIADKMGYSESLIRQETIVIYQKLGINGRRDLARE